MAEKLEPRRTKASPRTVERLARLEPGEKVLTIYLDLDPAAFATPAARETQIKSVLDEAEKLLAEAGDEKKVLAEDIEAVRSFLDSDSDWPKDAGAVAVFRSGPAGLFELVKLPAPVPGMARIESSPHVEPLADLISPGGWCVVLINRRNSRIFLGSPDWLRETGTVKDDVHGQHDQGGWSQARFERSIEKEVADHIVHTSNALMDALKHKAFSKLAVGVARELWPEVEQKFHQDLKDRIVGRVELDIENASLDEVRTELGQLAVIRGNEEEKELMGRLEEALGTGGRASAGIEDVLEALVSQKVEMLLIDENFEATGVACTTCSWVGVSGDVCPADGGELERDVDLVERAIEMTYAQSGEVQTMRYNRDLGGHGSIATLNRF